MKPALAIAGLLLAFSFAAPSSAANRDPFIGEWLNFDCGELTCMLLIQKRKKDYVVNFSAFKWGQEKKPVCKAAITMTRGPLEFTASYHPPDALSGYDGEGQRAYIEPMSEVELSFVTTSLCKRIGMGGLYHFSDAD